MKNCKREFCVAISISKNWASSPDFFSWVLLEYADVLKSEFTCVWVAFKYSISIYFCIIFNLNEVESAIKKLASVINRDQLKDDVTEQKK